MVRKFHREGNIEKRIVAVVLIYTAVLAAGTIGYHFLEKWEWIDSLYMTVITITTVGFGEVHLLHPAGKLFTIGLVLLGVGSFTYTFGTIIDYLVAGELGGFLQKRKMKNQIEKLHNHYIVCGFGRVGFQVAEELDQGKKPVVLVEEDPKGIVRAEAHGFLFVQGNANRDEALIEAGIERAAGLIATLGTDAHNIMLVLSGRALNSKLFIVARANYEEAISKLKTAGADRVISPYSIGGRRMAQLMLRPNVVRFLDVVMRGGELEMWMEDVTVRAESKLEGRSIGQARIREKTGSNILGLRRRDGRLVLAPTPETVLEAEDNLIILGTRQQIEKLQELNR